MTPTAMLFMAVSWTLVLGLTLWSFHRVLRAPGRRAAADDADSPGDGSPDGAGGP